MKQVFDSLFTLVNPAIKQASRIIYELQNATDGSAIKPFTKLLDEGAMKMLGCINGFPNLCYVTKENVLQLYSITKAISDDRDKVYTPFYGQFLNEASISRIEQFQLECDVGRSSSVIDRKSFID